MKSFLVWSQNTSGLCPALIAQLGNVHHTSFHVEHVTLRVLIQEAQGAAHISRVAEASLAGGSHTKADGHASDQHLCGWPHYAEGAVQPL